MGLASPGSARWRQQWTALVALLVAVLGVQALLGPPAGASGTSEFVPISGSGSTWSSSALERWRLGVGQQQAGELGYAPLPVNLVQTALGQLRQIPGGAPRDAGDDLRNWDNPALAADGTDLLVKTVPLPPTCELSSALTQCVTGTGGAAAPTAATGSTSTPVPAVVSPPAGAKITATMFMAIPSGPVIQGTPVILVAQVMPATASGTVQFKDGDIELGLPRPVVGGFALTITSKLAKGTHSLTAMFTATDQTAFGPSTPPPVSLTVIGLS